MYPMQNSVNVISEKCIYKACGLKIFDVFKIFFLLILISLLHCHHRYG